MHVEGVVQDERGRPVAHIRLLVWDHAGRRVATLESDADGRFSAEIPQGWTRIRAEPRVGDPYAAAAVIVEQATSGVIVRVLDAGRVECTLVDAEGAPLDIEGLAVELTRIECPLSDAGGGYGLFTRAGKASSDNIARGVYRVSVAMLPRPDRDWEFRFATRITVGHQTTAVRIECRRRGGATETGGEWVTAGEIGAPLA